MQHTTGVAVVAAHLAATDRRALSQAWYSALHLAELPPAVHGARPLESLREATSRACPARILPTVPQPGACDTAREARRTGRGAIARCSGRAVDGERRIPRTELTRRIERGLTRRPSRAAALFSVRGAGGRVALLVRTDGASTRIVAVCTPPLRERVERALAQARFALAARGVRAEVA